MAEIKAFKYGIVYKSVNDLDIKLDLYLPNHAKDLPILLWFHGGGLLQGYRDRLPPHMRRASQKRNLAVVTADYRLAPQVSIEDILKDVRDCIKFVRTKLTDQLEDANALDPSRLVVSGSSAGGYLALLAGIYVEPKPNAIVPIYPITDPFGTFFTQSQPSPPGLTLLAREELAEVLDATAAPVACNEPDSLRANMYARMMHDANLAELWHVPKGEAAQHFRLSKQICTRGCCPAYVLHGDTDTAVGIEQADEVVGSMLGCGVEVVYERVHGEEHLLDHEPDYENEQLYCFVASRLQKKR